MSSYGQDGFTGEDIRTPYDPRLREGETGFGGRFGLTLADVRKRDEGRLCSEDEPVPELELYLPHQCDEWAIAAGDRAHVRAAALRLREELDAAIKLLSAEDQEGNDHEV